MKKLIAAFFLLLGAVIVLLATIDLTPFLVPEKAATTTMNDLAPQKPGAPPIPKEEAAKPAETVQASADDPDSDTSAEPPLDEIYPEQEQVVMAHQVKPVIVTATKPAEMVAKPIELEVTTLPPGEYPFSILVGTFQKKETAQRAISLYRQRGITTFWVKVDLEGRGVRYRQFNGFFSSTAQARQYLLQSTLDDKLVKPTSYAALLGIYTDKSKLADAFVKAEQTGVMPYILGSSKGDYFLYVGAFYTHVGAVDQCAELSSAGLNCEPVKRRVE